MSLLHTVPAPLEHLRRRVFRRRSHGCSLRCGQLLCKPHFYHHLSCQASSHTGVLVCTGFGDNRDSFCRKTPQRKTSVPLCKTDRGTSFLQHLFYRSSRPFRAVFCTRDTFAQFLWYHYHKLYSQTGRSKVILLFHTFYLSHSTHRQNITVQARYRKRRAVFSVRFYSL